MVSPQFYVSDEAMAREQKAARERYERYQGQKSADKSNIVDAEFYEIDPIAGVIEDKRTKGRDNA